MLSVWTRLTNADDVRAGPVRQGVLRLCEGKMTDAMDDSADGRTVRRLLALLRALNAQNGSTISALSRQTGISRQALYRLAEPLAAQGLVRRAADGRLHLTAQVRDLASGYRDEDALVEAAGPVLEELQRQVVWPTDLATYEDGEMRLRDTTRRFSPLVLDRASTGFRLPVLQTGLGLAWFAALDAARQVDLLPEIARRDPRAAQPAFVARLLAQAAQDGYGRRHTGFMKETNTIALPVRAGDQVLGSVGITFIASALTPAEAASRHLPALQRAADDVAAAFSARSRR
jgi:IclR family mhp operon transcriptional activator